MMIKEDSIFTAQPIALPEDLVNPVGELYEDCYIKEKKMPNGEIIKEITESGKFYIRGHYINDENININSIDIRIDPDTLMDVTPFYIGVDLADKGDVTYCDGVYLKNEN